MVYPVKWNLIGVALSAMLLLPSLWEGPGMGLFAQNISISATGVVPDTSAMLDIVSTTKGMLIPRMSTTERNAIPSPANSLLIFNTTTRCFEAYDGPTSTWVAFGCIGCTVPSSVTASATPNPICEGSTLTLTGGATGATSWSWTGPNSYTSTAQSPTIAGITTAGAGVYTLTAGNACGWSAPVSTASVSVSTSCITTMSWTDPTTGTCDGQIYLTIQGIVAAMPVGPINVRITAHQVNPLPNYGDWKSTFLATSCVRQWLNAWATLDLVSYNNWNPAVCQATDTTGTDYFFVCKNDGGGSPQIAIYPTTASPGQYMKVYMLDRTGAWCDLAGVNNRPGFDVQVTNGNTNGTIGDYITFSWW